MPDQISDAGGTIDPNSIAAHVIVGTGKEILSGGAKLAQSTWKALVGLFTEAFSDSIESTYKRCLMVKTIMNPEAPIPLLDIYTHVNFTCRDNILDDDSLIAALESQRHVCITGTGGSGKSVFMKYLAVTSYQNSRGRLPLFVELRHLNGISSKQLVPFIFHSNNRAKSKLELADFEKALAAGLFTLILDGFDEVDIEQRAVLEGEILNLAAKYPDNVVVVSSRPDERFGSWDSFYVYNVQGMTKEQVTFLISRINFDEEVKRRFKEEIAKTLYESHESFLKVPLLASMMLLTYNSFAEVPSKVHVFYEQAYQTLFRRHDAQKSLFQRKRFTKLDIDEFRKCFATFCRMSYLKSVHSFESDTQVNDFAKRALDYWQVSEKPSDFVRDSAECVCLLQKEGMSWSFTHRSFQEYFCADFICKYAGEKFPEIMDGFCGRIGDSVAQMALEMFPDLTERDWVKPRLSTIAQFAGKEKQEVNVFRFARDSGFRMVIYLIPRAKFHWAVTGRNFTIFLGIAGLYSSLISNVSGKRKRVGTPFSMVSLQDTKDFLNRHKLVDDPRFAEVVSLLNSGSEKKIARRDEVVHLNTIELVDSDLSWFLESSAFSSVAGLLERLQLVDEDVKARVESRARLLEA